MALGNAARGEHRFGEGAHAHHFRHVKQGGLATVDNRVILCANPAITRPMKEEISVVFDDEVDRRRFGPSTVRGEAM